MTEFDGTRVRVRRREFFFVPVVNEAYFEDTNFDVIPVHSSQLRTHLQRSPAGEWMIEYSASVINCAIHFGCMHYHR